MTEVIDLSEDSDGRDASLTFPCSDPPTLDDVKRAIDTIFHCPDARKRNAANAWVVHFSPTPTAWRMSRSLLTSPVPEVQQFGATIILDKVRLSWGSLDQQTLMSLPASLLKIVAEGTKTAQFTRRTLRSVADALAICFVRGVLGNASAFTAEQVSAMKRALFSLRSTALTGLIECLSEMAAQTVALSATWTKEHGARVRAELKSLTRETLVTIKWVLSPEAPSGVTETLKNDAIRCLQSWLTFGIPSEIMADMSDFFLGTFRFLHSPTTFETAVDVIDRVMSLKVRHIPTIHQYVRQVIGLKPMFLSARSEDDLQVCVGISRLATRCGEQYIAQIINRDLAVADSDGLCKLIVECTNHPVHDVASLAFHFWTLFGAALMHSAADARNHFNPFFQSVLQRILIQSAFPRDSPPSLASWKSATFFMALEDTDEEWRQFRECAIEPLQACLEVLGAARCLGFLYQIWDKHCGQPSSNWPILESLLFAVDAITPRLSAEQVRDLPALKQILSKAIRISTSHPLLSRATCKLLGSSSRWLSDNPTLHDPILKYLFGAVLRDVLSLPACLALKDFAKDCASHLSQKVSAIMNNVRKTLVPFLNEHIPLQPSFTQRSLRDAKTHLFNFIVMVAKPADASALQAVVAWITQEVATNLKAILDPADSGPTEFHIGRDGGIEHESLSSVAMQEIEEESIISELAILTNVYRHFIVGTTGETTASLVMSSARTVWPMLDTITHKWPGNEDIMEAVSLYYSAIWQSCKSRAAAITPMMVSKLLNSFQRWRFPFCLSALHRAVLSLGQDKNTPARWQSITARVLALTLSKLSAETLQSAGSASSLSSRLQVHNDLLSSLFPFLESVTNYSVDSLGLVPPPGMKSLFGLTSTSILIGDQESTSKGAMLFLLAMLRHKSGSPALASLFSSNLSAILRAVLLFNTRSPVSAAVQKIAIRLLEQLMAIFEQDVRSILSKAKPTLTFEPQNTVFNAFFHVTR
ncbi:MAG: hypothetical protein Q8P67_03275 [archaeon]|nr:hypothetical protein [archaeon]